MTQFFIFYLHLMPFYKVTYHSAFIGVFIAAGVVGPCPVALRMQEPMTAVGANLCNHLCR